ncbi:DegT/DnrJ/EryC1/StrS aminotransferase family protein [Hydrogenimonas sp. SS33]|uniref:DegT/DnrJ/EryC1/StrS family aminotransferase n=1 Tax=Hydrogenimonas leucolamina TaxID=2954236 RepID=UPI00336C23E7
MAREIPFFVPDIGPAERDEVDQVLSLEGEGKIDALEEAFRKKTGATYAVSTNSGTSALHLAMCAMDLKRGDKIICSVNAFPSVPEVVRHFDAEPIFVDIDGDDFNIDLDALEKVLEENRSKKLKGAIVNHVAGQPTDLARLYDIAAKYGIKIVEDASDALGGTYDGRPIGATGADITCFSFSPHMKNSIANAGMLLCEDDTLHERATLLRNHAIQSDGWDKYGNLEYVYDVVDIGCKYDISLLDAAYALAQYRRIDKMVARRQAIAAKYDKALAGVKHVTLPVKKRDHIYQQYIIRIDRNRDGFARALKEKGVHTGLHYIPLHLLSYYKQKYGLRVNDFQQALQTYQQVLSLPIYHNMSDDDVAYVCNAVQEVAAAHI